MKCFVLQRKLYENNENKQEIGMILKMCIKNKNNKMIFLAKYLLLLLLIIRYSSNFFQKLLFKYGATVIIIDIKIIDEFALKINKNHPQKLDYL